MSPDGRDGTISAELESTCAQEAIHLLGTVQSYGFLMVVDVASRCIVQVSAGIARHWPVCVAIVALFYAPAMMARTNGQTVGRQATGIRVVRANGKPVGFGFAMVREVLVKAMLFGFLFWTTFGVVSLIDVLWPLWDEENRALHDFIVDTRSIRVSGH